MNLSLSVSENFWIVHSSIKTEPGFCIWPQKFSMLIPHFWNISNLVRLMCLRNTWTSVLVFHWNLTFLTLIIILFPVKVFVNNFNQLSDSQIDFYLFPWEWDFFCLKFVFILALFWPNFSSKTRIFCPFFLSGCHVLT